MEFLLKNYKNEFDLNFPSTEKKSKINARLRFNKEYTGFTPCMLSVCSPLSSDTQTVEVLKIFKNYNNINYDLHDFNKDNLLHLAIKSKKIETAKYLVEALDLKKLLNEVNKEGYSPLSLSQHLNQNDFISYFIEITGIDEQKIQESVEELIQESQVKQSKDNKKKKKKKKNNDNDIPSLLNSTEYQETLKVPKTSSKNSYEENSNSSSLRSSHNKSKPVSSDTSNNVNNRDKLHALLDSKKIKKKKEKQEIKEEKKVEKIKEEEKEVKEEEDEKEEKEEEESK